MQQLYSALFKLNSNDFVKGLWVAIATAVVTLMQQAITTNGFNFGTYDWGLVGQAALMGALGYLLKNFASDSNGAVLGKFGGIKRS